MMQGRSSQPQRGGPAGGGHRGGPMGGGPVAGMLPGAKARNFKGTHRELMENCETYKEIALSQLSKEELS